MAVQCREGWASVGLSLLFARACLAGCLLVLGVLLGAAQAGDTSEAGADADQRWLAAHPSVRLGIHEAPPLVTRQGGAGRHVGLGLDYLALIGRRLGMSFERVPFASWSQLLDAAKNREVDVVITVPRTPERADYLEFSPPYYVPLSGAQDWNRSGAPGGFVLTNAYAIGSRNDWPELARILARAMAEVTPAEREAVWRRWLPSPKGHPMRSVAMGLFGLAVVLGLGLWARSRRHVLGGFLRGSIRRNLALMVFLSVVPASVLTVVTGLAHRGLQIEAAQNEARLLAAQAARWIQEQTRVTHEALVRVAEASCLRATNAAQVVARANELLQDQRQLDLFFFDDAGAVVGSGRADLIGQVNVAQLEFAKDVAKHRHFVVGNSVMSRTYAHPMIHFALPVNTNAPSLRLFIGRAAQLDTWGLEFEPSAACPGACLSIADRNGVLLHSYPAGANGLKLGEAIPSWLWDRISGSGQTGEGVCSDPAGGRWFLASRSLELDRTSSPDLHLVVSVPDALISGPANRALWRGLLLLALATTAAMLIVIPLGNRTLVDTLDRITAAARRLGNGDLSARVGARPEHEGELWDLARTFDTMAERLERHRAQLERQQEELRDSEEKFATAFRTSPYAVTLTRERDGTLIEVNDTFTRLTGYTRAEVIGKTTTSLGLWADPRDRERMVAALRAGQPVADEEVPFRRRDGVFFLGQMSAQVIQLRDEACVLSSIADISQRKRAEAQMAAQFEELRRWHHATLDREGRVMELKREVNALLARAGEAPLYPSVTNQPGSSPDHPSPSLAPAVSTPKEEPDAR